MCCGVVLSMCIEPQSNAWEKDVIVVVVKALLQHIVLVSIFHFSSLTLPGNIQGNIYGEFF